MRSTQPNQVLNTLEEGYVDRKVMEALEARRIGQGSERGGVEIREDLLPLFQSRLFTVGPSRFLTQLKRL